MLKNELIALAVKTAKTLSIDPSLFCGLVETESSWNPHASRFEQGFFDRYIVPLKLTDANEARDRATSFGLTQVLGQTARELGFRESLVLLCDPEVNLFLGAKKLKKCLDAHAGMVKEGLLAYNGGSDKGYPGRVAANQLHYYGPVEVLNA